MSYTISVNNKFYTISAESPAEAFRKAVSAYLRDGYSGETAISTAIVNPSAPNGRYLYNCDTEPHTIREIY